MAPGSLWFPFHSSHLATTSGVGQPFSTVASQVFSCVDFWILWGVHVLLFWVRDRLGHCRQNEELCDLEKARWREYEITVEELWELNALVVIMLFGYSWLCYHRLLAFFEASGDLIRHLDRVSLTLRIYFDDSEDRWNIFRYLLASLRTSKFGVQAQRAAASKSQAPQFQWDVFMRTQIVGDRLLLQEEADFLKQIEGNKQEILCSWCVVSMRNLLHSWRERHQSSDSQDFSLVQEHTLVLGAVTEDTKRVRESVSRIGEHLQFVFPSSILPFLSIGLWADLLLLGYAMLFIQDGNGSYLSTLIYPMILFFLLGLREASNSMVSPLSDATCYKAIDAWTDAFISDSLTNANNPNAPFRHNIGAVCEPHTIQKVNYQSSTAHAVGSKSIADAPWAESLEQSTQVTKQLDATLNRLLDLLPGTVHIPSNPAKPAGLSVGAAMDEHPVGPAGSTPSDRHSTANDSAWSAPHTDARARAAADEEAAAHARPQHSAAGQGGSRSGGFIGRGGKRSLLSEAKRAHLLGPQAAGSAGEEQAGNRAPSSHARVTRLNQVTPLPPGAADR